MEDEYLILVQWSCRVPEERLESFVEFCKDVLKPFYESHGCIRWELFMPLKVDRRYFSYQTAQDANRYTEQLILKSIEDFEKILEVVETDSHAREIFESFGKRFNVSSCTFAILQAKVW